MLFIKSIHLLCSSEMEALQGLLSDYDAHMHHYVPSAAAKPDRDGLAIDLNKTCYRRPDAALFLAVYHGVSVGCVGLKRRSETVCELERLYVTPGYRRFGIGSALCQTLLETAKGYGYHQVILPASEEMKEVAALCRKLGFNQAATLRVRQHPYCIHFSKALSSLTADKSG